MPHYLTPEAWQGSRVLVTGATGFLGSHLVHRLLGLRVHVSVLLREQSRVLRIADVLERLDVCYGDLAEPQGVDACLAHTRPEIVFHLAAAGSYPGPDAAALMRANVVGTAHLLEAMKRHAPGRLVNVGSVAAYGAGQCLREDDPLQPTGAYGASKAAADLLGQAYGRSSELTVVTVRPFTPFGPLEHSRRLIPNTILNALRGEDMAMTPGEQQRDFLFVDDVVDGMLAAALYEGSSPVFNLCSGTGRSVRSVAEQIVARMGAPIRLQFGAVPYREGEIRYQSGDNRRAYRELGWAPHVSFEEGLDRAIAWWCEHAGIAAQLAA